MPDEPVSVTTSRGRARSRHPFARHRPSAGLWAIAVLWLALGAGLAAITTRIVDWFVMTDELLYERLALSVDQIHSPLPYVHGTLIPSVNQLYPLLLATVAWYGKVPDALRLAHLVDAFVMASVCIPAYLLGRRVTGSRPLALAIGLASVTVPWILYAGFLLTEVVGYPAFLWAVLALQAAAVSPSRRRDALLLGALVLAVLARTQFFVLVLAAPVAVLLAERGDGAGTPAVTGHRVALVAIARRAAGRHRLLVQAYALVTVTVLVLVVAGRLSSVLGTYAGTVGGHLLPAGIPRALLDHVAMLALSVGILPAVVGLAWALANARGAAPVGERGVFAVVVLVTVALLVGEVTIFDQRFGAGVVRDRYLFYLVPLLLVALGAALTDRARPRRSLAIPTAVVAAGFLVARLPSYPGLNIDTPASTVVRYLLTSLRSHENTRIALAVATLLLALLFIQASALLPRRGLTVLVTGTVLCFLSLETGYAFTSMFAYNGTSGRPLTLPQGSMLDWVDGAAGAGTRVTMIPYPMIDGDYWSSVAYWWDLEFWNRDVERDAYVNGAFEGTPSTFPKDALRFDAKTGYTNVSPSQYLVQAADDTRFRLAGDVDFFDRGARLIFAGDSPWHADWLTLGLYDDGWTKPGTPAVIRVFPAPGRGSSELYTLFISIRSPGAKRAVELRSNAGRWSGVVSASGGTTVAEIRVCRPAHGFTDVTLTAAGATAIHGDMSNYDSFGGTYRTAGVYLAEIDLESAETGCAR